LALFEDPEEEGEEDDDDDDEQADLGFMSLISV
jgi:hypothetical protein